MKTTPSRPARMLILTTVATTTLSLSTLTRASAEPAPDTNSTSAATTEVEVTTNEELAPKVAANEVAIAAEIAGAPAATGPSKVIDTVNGVAAPVPGTDVTVVIPGADVTSKTPTGTVLEGTGTSQAVAQDVGENGRRVTFVINNATDPVEYPLTFRGAESIKQTATGSYLVFDKAGEVIIEIGQPYAIDSLGNSVSTHYAVKGNTLVQTVDHHADGVVLPVHADPTISFGWTGVTAYLTKRETSWVARGWNLADIAAQALGIKYSGKLAQAVTFGLSQASQYANSVQSRGGCLLFHKTYVGPGFSIGHYFGGVCR